jgi:hypothetical protein
MCEFFEAGAAAFKAPTVPMASPGPGANAFYASHKAAFCRTLCAGRHPTGP